MADKSRQFLVTWEIDITADDHRDAARQALEIQRDPESTATVFNVKEFDSIADEEVVDLLEEEEAE